MSYTNPVIMYVCQGKRRTCQGYLWQNESENYVLSRPVIATNVITGNEAQFPSLHRASDSLFGVNFDHTKFISDSCKLKNSYRGYKFRRESVNDGFVNVEYPGAVKIFGTEQKPIFQLNKDTKEIIS